MLSFEEKMAIMFADRPPMVIMMEADEDDLESKYSGRDRSSLYRSQLARDKMEMHTDVVFINKMTEREAANGRLKAMLVYLRNALPEDVYVKLTTKRTKDNKDVLSRNELREIARFMLEWGEEVKDVRAGKKEIEGEPPIPIDADKDHIIRYLDATEKRNIDKRIPANAPLISTQPPGKFQIIMNVLEASGRPDISLQFKNDFKDYYKWLRKKFPDVPDDERQMLALLYAIYGRSAYKDENDEYAKETIGVIGKFQDDKPKHVGLGALRKLIKGGASFSQGGQERQQKSEEAFDDALETFAGTLVNYGDEKVPTHNYEQMRNTWVPALKKIQEVAHDEDTYNVAAEMIGIYLRPLYVLAGGSEKLWKQPNDTYTRKAIEPIIWNWLYHPVEDAAIKNLFPNSQNKTQLLAYLIDPKIKDEIKDEVKRIIKHECERYYNQQIQMGFAPIAVPETPETASGGDVHHEPLTGWEAVAAKMRKRVDDIVNKPGE